MEKERLKTLMEFRKTLHKHPELSGKEFETQKRIIDFLESHDIKDIQPISNTGLLCTFDSGVEGKTIMIRGDIDALPIVEINNFEHQSTAPGVSHKCGHDGHTAILCALALKLKAQPIEKGKVVLLFQPAEENGEGAVGVLQDTRFNISPDIVFALHNLPGYPLHEVVYRNGSFTAAAQSVIFHLDGKTSHAAEPELGINPALAISEIIAMFDEVSNPDLNSETFALATPIHLQMGEKAYGVSAGHGAVHYTLRTWKNEVMHSFSTNVVEKAQAIAKKYGLDITVGWTEQFAANQNNDEAVAHVVRAAEKLGLSKSERPSPFKWGEDFGLFTEKFPGAMFGIGSGEDCPALHNPDYDFPDELISTGSDLFYQIINQVINE